MCRFDRIANHESLLTLRRANACSGQASLSDIALAASDHLSLFTCHQSPPALTERRIDAAERFLYPRQRVRGQCAINLLNKRMKDRDVVLPAEIGGDRDAKVSFAMRAILLAECANNDIGQSNQDLVSHAAVRIRADMLFGIKVIGESGIDLARLVQCFYLFR